MTENEAIERVTKTLHHELRADDVVVWRGNRFPTREDIDRAAASANARGWNGTTLEHFCKGSWMDTVEPSEEVLS
jgi:hypothetical protein